jgi:hypothetical protein
MLVNIPYMEHITNHFTASLHNYIPKSSNFSNPSICFWDVRHVAGWVVGNGGLFSLPNMSRFILQGTPRTAKEQHGCSAIMAKLQSGKNKKPHVSHI